MRTSRTRIAAAATVAALAATLGWVAVAPANAATSDLRINEVESSGGIPVDWVELVNTGSSDVDASGLVIKDSDDTHVFTIPAGTTLAAGAFATFDVDIAGGFGLGGADSARLFEGATLIDSYAWTAHAATTYGRCPDGGGTFVTTIASTKGAANDCSPPAPPNVKINEVESNGDQVADWVELTNLGASAADISGWKILDGDPSHAATPVVVPANTTLAPGAHYAIYTEIAQSPGFGLGVGDSVTLYLADGTTQVDTTTWGAHPATTWGRCPDGTGDFRETTTSTRGVPNACSPVRINEIESDLGSPDDWVELTNISGAPVDVSGWALKDNVDTTTYVLPAGTIIPAHGYYVAAKADFVFGLGGADSVRLYDASSALVESYAWTAHAVQTYGRCKDGVGDFKDTKAPTKGAANSCPGLDTLPWPGPQTVTTADLTESFIADLSGLVFDPADADVLWASQNKKGTLFKLVRSGDNWVPAAGWETGKDPRYPSGAGAPDTEGVTIGPDGFVYLASERNNEASGVSRMSILRYDPAASPLVPTNEWDLTGLIPAAGANLGLEGVTFVPDAFLVAGGFVDASTGTAYDPASYPLHGSGLYFVAVEDTGDLIGFALDSDGVTAHRIVTVDSGFEHLADVNFDAELGRLRAVTDDTVDGKTSLLTIDDAGAFVVDTAYDRPAGMPNLNNEGMAVAPQSRCVDGLKEVVWSDDGDTDGHSLRRGAITCTVPPDAPQVVTFTSAAPDPGVVGQSYDVDVTGGGSSNPVELSIAASSAAVCSISGDVVHLDHPGLCTIEAKQAAAPGYLAGSATQDVTVDLASSTTTVTITPTSLRATVAVAAPGSASVSGSVQFTVDGVVVGSSPLAAGVATFAKTLSTTAHHTVSASYAGTADLHGSTGSAERRNPLITASVDSAFPQTFYGWFRANVTVTFTCTPTTAPLVATCPAPVTFTSGTNNSVSRTILATDGGRASVSVAGIRIDKVPPTVKITGVKAGGTYKFTQTPPAKCSANDALSGVASCVLTHSHEGRRWTTTAVATDKAGNTATASVSYWSRS